MANLDVTRGDIGILERLINYAGNRFAKLMTTIIYDSSEKELFTEENPGIVSMPDIVVDYQISQPIPIPYTHEPSANTDAVIMLQAGGAGIFNIIGGVYWSYDKDPKKGSLTINYGETTVFKVDITKNGPGFFRFCASSARG